MPVEPSLKFLSGRRVLVVEDDYFIADDLRVALEGAGASVIGPASTREEAMILIEESPPDLAVLDINLQGDMSFEIADELEKRGAPFIFATGYGLRSIPARHAGRQVVGKPFVAEKLTGALAREAIA